MGESYFREQDITQKEPENIPVEDRVGHDSQKKFDRDGYLRVGRIIEANVLTKQLDEIGEGNE
jgi:hypothetical protein